ncbi:hypothetical protein IDJ77_21505 [Mucilaginibacter sp. ZT4R22]|uniref:Intracellular septation protein A n=1 Tax=Mucilaginibacter pankratovii TaxID=2772110 RepID=A0ABR7WVS9_9SPHI|nr:hypothetical protein [Mucilaginibacter pankratovii]MBD1366404.1 hypothetical protein [Mucilaginibacter pankratovii]
MKVTFKTHTYATWLACFYAAVLLLVIILRYSEVEIGTTGVLYYIKLATLQTTYILLLVYLTILLAAVNERRSAVIAFSLLVVIAIAGNITIFIPNYQNLIAYMGLYGLLCVITFIFLAIEIFKLRNPIISKYYKVLGAIFIAQVLLKGGMRFGLAYLAENYDPGIYRFGWLYADLFSLFTPIVLIVLLKRTEVLLDGYPQPTDLEEEYM